MVCANPEFYEVLSQSSSKLLNVDYNAGQGSIRNGLVSSGKLRGFDMYKSNNIPSTTNAAGQCWLVTFLLRQRLKRSPTLRLFVTQTASVTLFVVYTFTVLRYCVQKLWSQPSTVSTSTFLGRGCFGGPFPFGDYNASTWI